MNQSTFVESEASTFNQPNYWFVFIMRWRNMFWIISVDWRDLVTFTLLDTSPVSGCIINDQVLVKINKILIKNLGHNINSVPVTSRLALFESEKWNWSQCIKHSGCVYAAGHKSLTSRSNHRLLGQTGGLQKEYVLVYYGLTRDLGACFIKQVYQISQAYFS